MGGVARYFLDKLHGLGILDSAYVERKGRFRKRVVLANVPSFPVLRSEEHGIANVPSFRFSFWGSHFRPRNYTGGNITDMRLFLTHTHTHLPRSALSEQGKREIEVSKRDCNFQARLKSLKTRPLSQERKSSPKRKFSGRISRGHPGVIRADIPVQNFGQDGQNRGKTSIWARISMTRRRGRPRP